MSFKLMLKSFISWNKTWIRNHHLVCWYHQCLHRFLLQTPSRVSIPKFPWNYPPTLIHNKLTTCFVGWMISSHRAIPNYFILRPRKLTWQWKHNCSKMHLLLKMVLFQCHFRFRGATFWDSALSPFFFFFSFSFRPFWRAKNPIPLVRGIIALFIYSKYSELQPINLGGQTC